MNALEIRTALIKPIVDNSDFGIDWNYENKSFKPSHGTPFGRAYMLGNGVTQTSMGDTGCDRRDGVFQISLYYPENKGDIPALTKADEIAGVYKSGSVFSYNGVNVTISSIEPLPALVVNGWYQIDLTINYYAFIRRS